MRFRRFLLFLFIIAIGAGVGLAVGWMVIPPPYANLKPDTLRSDYKADYVLMIAEVYRKDGNLASAVRRLAVLEDQPPERLVSQALVSARDLSYSQPDVETLAYLASALSHNLPEGTPSGSATAEAPDSALTPTPTAGAVP